MSFKKLKQTSEQLEICEKSKLGKDMFITALAGASKTTSGKFIANTNPNREYLTLFFNKANALDGMKAKDKPENMSYSTIHSLAYSNNMNDGYKSKLSAFLDYKDITKEMYNIFGGKDSSKIIRGTITLWQQSDYTDITKFIQDNIREITNSLGKDIKIDSIKLSKVCKLYWNNMKDENSKTKITHDTYLKMFHLQNSRVTHFKDKKLDTIILEEFQDSNDVTLAIFNNQTHLQRIVSGDINQGLYSWRGAKCSIEPFKDWDYSTLTESFRFGDNIAEMANRILDYKLRCKERLIGAMKEPSPNKSIAILCRTNASVLSNVFKLIEKGESVYCVTNLDSMFNQMYHISAVMANQKPQFESEELKNYNTKELMQELFDESPEIKRVHNIALKISDLNNGLHNGIEKLKSSLEKKMNKANYIVSTIHGSKGLGFGTVIISNDLINIKEKTDQEKIKKEVEAKLLDDEFSSLLYVAITRSKNNCIVPEYLKYLFED